MPANNYDMKLTINQLILCCMTSIALLTACEKADIQKPVVDNQPIVPRGPAIDCEDCPVEDCCCAVELIDLGPVSFELCGTSSPNVITTPCSDTWGNCSISGFLLPYTIMNLYDLELFCMPLGSSFRIKSTPLSGSGTVRITCQYGQLGSVSEDVTFPGQAFFYVDEECVISTHCPL
jgi:hypothetical protein